MPIINDDVIAQIETDVFDNTQNLITPFRMRRVLNTIRQFVVDSAYVNSDSLQNVTDRGAITDKVLQVGGIKINTLATALSNFVSVDSQGNFITNVGSGPTNFLRIDGNNSMEDDLDMGGNYIDNVNGLFDTDGNASLQIGAGFRYLVDSTGHTGNPFVDYSSIITGLAINTQNLSGRYGRLHFDNILSSRDYQFPDASGTVALTSDLSAYLPLAGGVLLGNLNGVTPTELSYLSGATSSIQSQLNSLMIGIGGWKTAARVLVSTNINLSSPGSSLSGVTMSVGDRFVANGQSTGSQNGVYKWNGGSVAATRTTDCSTGDASATGVLGMVITIEEGVYADQLWVLSTDAPITIGTSSLLFVYGNASVYTGSNGITLTGNNFTLNNAYFTGDISISSGVVSIGSGRVTNSMLAGGIDLTSKVTNILPGANGGTGISNAGKTITLAGNFITTGAFNVTLAVPQSTIWTLPNTVNETLAGLATAQTFSAKQTFTAATTEMTAITLLDTTYKNALSAGGSTGTTFLTVGSGFSRLQVPNAFYMFSSGTTYLQAIGASSTAMVLAGGYSTLGISPITTFTAASTFNATSSIVTVSGAMSASGGTGIIGAGYAWTSSVNQTGGTGMAVGYSAVPSITNVSNSVAGFYSNIAITPTGGGIGYAEYHAGTASSVFGGAIQLIDTTPKIAIDVSAFATLRIANGFSTLVTPAPVIQLTGGNTFISNRTAGSTLSLGVLGGGSNSLGVVITTDGILTSATALRSILTVNPSYVINSSGVGTFKAVNINPVLTLTSTANQVMTMLEINPSITTSLTLGSTLYGLRSRINIDVSGALTYNIFADGTSPNFFGGTVTMKGFTDASNASAGNVGEIIESTISTFTSYTTTATYQNITSITLSAGDWDIYAFGTFSSNSATITAGSNAIFNIATATASATGSIEGKTISYIPQSALIGTSIESCGSMRIRVSISSTTTYYLNTQATFTLLNPQFSGSISARRIR